MQKSWNSVFSSTIFRWSTDIYCIWSTDIWTACPRVGPRLHPSPFWWARHLGNLWVKLDRLYGHTKIIETYLKIRWKYENHLKLVIQFVGKPMKIAYEGNSTATQHLIHRASTKNSNKVEINRAGTMRYTYDTYEWFGWVWNISPMPWGSSRFGIDQILTLRYQFQHISAYVSKCLSIQSAFTRARSKIKYPQTLQKFTNSMLGNDQNHWLVSLPGLTNLAQLVYRC